MRISVRSSSARRARELQDALARAGVAAPALVGPGRRPVAEDVAVLDAAEETRAWAALEAERLASGAPRPTAIVAATPFGEPPESDALFDGWIQTDGPAPLVAREIASAHRAAIARDELGVRLETAAACGAVPALPVLQAPWRGLFIGEPHPFFLALERAMAEHGRLEAAFSSFMGFDFLHDDRFDAVALNANADAATALALCGALRRNARLHHLPTLMIADRNRDEVAVAAIERGAAFVLSREDDYARAIAWLFSRIRQGRRAAEVEMGLAAVRVAHGGPGSLMGEGFFLTHIDRLATAAHAGGHALALIGLRVSLAPGARRASASTWRRGVLQVAEICARLIQTEDSAALLEGDVVAIALPGATVREARATAERVASVTECTAFAAGETDAGPIVLARSIAELAPGESGAGLLDRTRSSLDLEGIRA